MSTQIAKMSLTLDYDSGSYVVAVLTKPDVNGQTAAYQISNDVQLSTDMHELAHQALDFGSKITKARAFDIFGQAAANYRR